MKVKLLTAVFEADRFGTQALKVTQRKSRDLVIAWVAGTVIDMSDASAEKYIANGLAEKVEEPSI